MKQPVIAILLCLAGHASGAYSPTPGYPAPGGTIFSGSGNAGQTVGRTSFYSGFDESQYADLAWTFTTIPNPYHSSEGSSDGNMTFSGYNPTTGIMTWSSTSNAVWQTAFGLQNLATQLVAQLQPYTGSAAGPLSSGFLVPTTAGMEGLSSSLGGINAWPLVDVDATGVQDQFQVWYQFQTVSGVPLLAYYDSSSSLGGTLNTGVTGNFFASQPIPEPSSALGAILGGAVFFGTSRRRKALR